ncbi:MAG: DUF4340 domain-containing protein [Deltaproteobacteria bacterium]|nr:DUF4340 domain-containing protein [Deltaproteobacteria bacterium]
MSLRKTLILAFLLVAALAYIVKVQMPHDEEKRAERMLFANLNNESIESISLSGMLGEFTLKNTEPRPHRTSGSQEDSMDVDALRKWQLADVQGADLDRSTLNALISALVGFTLDDKPLPAEDLDSDLEVYGLKTPALKIKVNGGGKTTELQFGKENSYVAKRYVRVGEGKDLYLVTPGLFAAANKTKNEFRNKAPLEFLDNELKSISIHSPQTGVTTFEIDDQYQWHITQPIRATASSKAMADLTREIRSMRAVTFLDGDLKLSDYGLDTPLIEVDMVFKGAAKREPLHLILSQPDGQPDSAVYLKVSDKPSIFKLESNPLPGISKPLDEFREFELFKFASDQAVQLDFEFFQAPSLSLVRTGDSWLVNSKPADINFVRGLLESLATLHAEGFPKDNRDYGFANPRMKLVLRLVGPEPEKKVIERTLMIGDSADQSAKEGTRYYAAVDGTSEVFLISKDTLKDIYPREDMLLQREAPTQPTPPATQPDQPK